jgi:Xaa-Pro aminopeptidase
MEHNIWNILKRFPQHTAQEEKNKNTEKAPFFCNCISNKTLTNMKKRETAPILISSPQNASDIRYLCGTEPPEAALLVKIGQRGTLFVSEMEYNRLRQTVRRGISVVHPEMAGSSWKKGPVDWIEKSVDVKKLIVSSVFPVGLAEKLRQAGFELTVSEELLCPQRKIKTAEEIKAVQGSQRAAVAAMKAAIRQIAATEPDRNGILRSGGKILTSETVRATICHTLLDHDCTAFETIVACGPHSADPHERGSGPLCAGQPIVIDIFPKSGKTGYWGDITRTVCRGAASAGLKKMYSAVKAAHAAALKRVKAGAWTDVVHNTAAEEMERRGYATGPVDGVPQGFIHGLGHGVGLEIHEAPRVSPTVHETLRAGHIITIEPGLYYPETGGIRLEDTIAVTRDGYKMLASCSKHFEI